MTQSDDPREEPLKRPEGARPAHEIVSKLSEHEKTVRDQELLLSAEKYFGGLNDDEKLVLGLSISAAPDEESRPAESKADQPASEPAAPAPQAVDPRRQEIGFPIAIRVVSPPTRSVVSDWVWAGLTALIFAGVVGWVLVGR